MMKRKQFRNREILFSIAVKFLFIKKLIVKFEFIKTEED
jgi:hypothetical protein